MILQGNEVVSSIAENITNAINSGLISSRTEISKIYKDTPIQGMVTPCAFIDSVNTESVLEIKEYSMWHYIIDVRCHPVENQTGVQSWARQLAIKLLECVDRISVMNQQVRAKSVEWRVERGVLHVISTYTFRVLRETDPGIPMRTMDYTERSKKRN